MRQLFYVLDGRTPVSATVEQWATMFENIDARRVAEDHVGGVRISTVFMGMDHNFGDGPPLLFETMTFREGEPISCYRCTTWIEAEAVHLMEVTRVKNRVVAMPDPG